MNSRLTLFRFLTMICACMIGVVSYAQSGVPEGILFQALAKDPSGVPAKGRVIRIKDMILQTSPNGNVAYAETFIVTASDDGVFTISIGQGTRISGASKLSAIDWGAGPYFLNIQVAIEPSIVTPEWKVDEQYVDMGTSQFWTVPFAFKAASVAGFELVMKSADTTAMLLPYLRKADTTSLSNRIDLRLQTGDTSTMLNNYARKTEINRLQDSISGKLRIADTTLLFINYARKTDVLNINDALKNKLNITDTTAMLTNYARKSELLKLQDSLTDRLHTADTTRLLANYAKRNELSLLSNGLNGKLNIADTLVMLNNYARKNEFSGIRDTLSAKLNISDTSAMLGKYLLQTDTARLLLPYYKISTAASDLSLREWIANKSSNTNLGSSDTLYPTQKAVKSYVDSVLANGNVTDATTLTKGKIKLAGDLNGTADLPVIGDGRIITSKIADSAVTLSKLQSIGSGKLIGNSSGSSATPSEITLGTGLSFIGNTLNATGGGGSQPDTFATNLVVYAVNGLGKYGPGQTIPSKGKTAAQVLMDVIMQTVSPTYVQPTAGISSNPPAGSYEIGSALNITLTASFNQNDAGAQTTSSFSKNGSGLGSNTDNIASLTAPVSYTATVSYAQSVVKNNNIGTPDPTGQISAGSKTSSAITFTPQAKRYWGYCSSITPADADIKAALGGGSELSSAKAKTAFDINISSGSNYIFYAYPASLGALSTLTVGGFGSLPSFTMITRSFSNTNGYAQSYNIYINPNAFSTPVSNIITN